MSRSFKLLGIAALGFVLAGCSHTPPNPELMVPVEKEVVEEVIPVDKTVFATEFVFSIPELRAKVGDKVRITLANNGKMPHDIRFDEFGAGSKILQPGETETIDFVVDKAGTFEYYCSVGNHRAQGMVGKLIVE